MPANSGRTVQEQTARIVPDTLATPYASTLFALAPRYFITDASLTNTPMAPAMKNAGIRHSSTCSRAYHFARWSDSMMPPVKRAQFTGSQKNTRNTATIHTSFFHSCFQSIILAVQS